MINDDDLEPDDDHNHNDVEVNVSDDLEEIKERKIKMMEGSERG